jgi:hypothetical protein
VPRAPGCVFKFCAPGHIFGGTEGVGYRFHVFRSRTCFWRYRGCRVPFSWFALPSSFSAVPRASGPVFLFCAPGLIFDASGGIGSRFHVLRARTYLRRYQVPKVPLFMFCAPGLVFGGTEGVEFRFHVLRTRTNFRRYRGCRVPFSYFALPDSFSAVPGVSSLVFSFCVPGLVFGGTGGVWSCFLVLRARTRFLRFRGHRFPFSRFARPDSFSAVPRAPGPFIHVLRSQTRFRRY